MRTAIAVAALLLVRPVIMTVYDCMRMYNMAPCQASHPPLSGSTPVISQEMVPALDYADWGEGDLMMEERGLHKRSPEADPSGKSP